MPKQNKHHKKKNKKNHKNKQNSSPKRQRKGNNTKNKNKDKNKSNNNKNDKINQVKNVKELKLKSEDVSLHSDSAEITTSSPISTSIHSPIKLHYYDADISDSDNNNNPYHHYNLSPLSHPTSTIIDCNHAQNNKMQILRSAKISHREANKSSQSSLIGINDIPTLIKTNSNPFVSPGFNKNNSPLISQHKFGPLSPLPFPTLSRASSSPLTGYNSPTRSILRSPLRPRSPYNNQDSTTSNSNNSVSFGAVEIHEFKLIAGSESDGVPEDGGLSLHLDDEEINNKTLKVDEYEKQRYDRWKERAKHLHWNKNKLTKAINDPEKYLFTAGREDEFYHSLTPKEREKRLSIDKKWKKLHSEQLNKEQKELNELRRSRKRNNIFCNCKPLSLMSISELKIVAKKYDIEIFENRKIKKGFLINRIKSKVSNYRNVCCWDDISCSCVAAGIDCHSGNEHGNFQCGCVKYHKKCHNKYGRYIYKTPHYDKQIINEWDKCYSIKTDPTQIISSQT